MYNRAMYKLYLDESGKSTLFDIGQGAPHFSVGAALVHKHSEEFIKSRGDQIRFKYWGHRASTVFHAYDMRRLSGDFTLFYRNPMLFREFKDDMVQYLNSASFRFICMSVNKLAWLD